MKKKFEDIHEFYDPRLELQRDVDKVFKDNFGYTPFGERMKDIQNEFFELQRWQDINNIKEETGDLIASLIQLCNESEWCFDELVQNSLKKIERRKYQYHTLGRKVKVAILGGAFNPITNGHIEAAQFVLNTSKEFDEVWLMPAYNHMHGKEMVSSDLRLEMCELAAEVDGRIKVFDYEIKNKLSGETFNLFKRLLDDEKYKDKYNFSMIIGMDNALSFDKWVNYEELERMVRFVVIPRRGVQWRKSGKDWFLNKPHILLEGDRDIPQEISSTLIRLAIESEETAILGKGLNKNVYEFIQKHELYK